MNDVAEPLTPSNCDLRGMPFMPLDVVRLGDSDLFALTTGDEFKAAVSLWCKSWLQIPAASLPDDDRILAHLSGAGRDWANVREMALRGWIRCSDGRLYHPVVAEKAREAWRHREMQRGRAVKRWEKEAADNAAKSHGNAAAQENDAVASNSDAVAYPAAMQGTGTVKGEGSKEEVQSPPVLPSVPDAPRNASLKPAAELRGHRLPEDWQPSHEDIGFAVSLDLNVSALAAEFRDYWRSVPGAKGRKTDWSATWRNRCRDKAQRQAPAPSRRESFSEERRRLMGVPSYLDMQRMESRDLLDAEPATSGLVIEHDALR